MAHTDIHTATPRRTPQWTMAERFRKAREDAGMSQEELAAACRFSLRSVVGIENGETKKPRQLTVEAWARVTNVYEEWLLYGEVPDNAFGWKTRYTPVVWLEPTPHRREEERPPQPRVYDQPLFDFGEAA